MALTIGPTVCCIAVADQVLVLDGKALAVRHDSLSSLSSSDRPTSVENTNDGQTARSDPLLVGRNGARRTVLGVLQEILDAAPYAVLVVSSATDGSEGDVESHSESDARKPTMRTPPALTRRHLEVLAEMSTGVTEREVGRRLGISERTVQLHVANVCRALGVRSQFQLGLAAAQLGLV